MKFSGGGSGKGWERDSVCLLPLPAPKDKFRSPTEAQLEAQATNGELCYFRAWVTDGDTELREGTICQPLGGALKLSGVGSRPHSLCPWRVGGQTRPAASGCGVCGGCGPAAGVVSRPREWG